MTELRLRETSLDDATLQEPSDAARVSASSDVLSVSQLPTEQDTTKSFGFIRNPFRHRRIDADEDHTIITGEQKRRQLLNADVAREVHEELLEGRAHALKNIGRQLQDLAKTVRRDGRKIVEKIKEDQLRAEETVHRILRGATVGAPLLRRALVPYPGHGFPPGSEYEKDFPIEGGAAVVSIPPISFQEIMELPEMSKLIKAVGDKVGKWYHVGIEGRDADEEDNKFFAQHIDKNDSETQLITFSIVLDCSQAGHQHGDGDDNGT